MCAQVVVAADAFFADECLRRGLHIIFRFEGVRFFSCREVVVVSFVPLSLQKIFGLQSIETEMDGHHHPVERRYFWESIFWNVFELLRFALRIEMLSTLT